MTTTGMWAARSTASTLRPTLPRPHSKTGRSIWCPWSLVLRHLYFVPGPSSLAVADRTWFSDKGRGARDKGRIHGPGRRSVPVLSRHAAEAGELRAARAAAGGEPDVAVRRGRHGLRLVHPVPEADSPAGGRRRSDGPGTADAGRVRPASGGVRPLGWRRPAAGGGAAAGINETRSSCLRSLAPRLR